MVTNYIASFSGIFRCLQMDRKIN